MAEITKMLTLSTAHIRPETANLLETEPETNHMCLSVYQKLADGESCGWFIYLGRPGTARHIPADLHACMRLARSNDCGILCLDRDGPEDASLTDYSGEWG